MKPEDYDPATLERLEQHLKTLHSAIDKLNECRQPPLRGITIEDEAVHDEEETEAPQPEEPQDSELEGDIDFGIGHFIEFSSYEEFKKFQKMPPINRHDIEECDLDEMIQKLISPAEGE